MKKLVALLSLFASSANSQTIVARLEVDSSTMTEFQMLSDTLNRGRVFFSGENHMFATFNSKFEIKFLKFLYKTQNVRHFIFEQSPGMGYIIEKYTMNGKTAEQLYLKKELYEPFYEMISEIKKTNDSLAPGEKIRFHGIDIERFPYFSIYALNDMVEELSSQFEGGEVFEQIIALASSDYARTGAEVLYPDQRDNFGFQFGEINGGATLRSIIADAQIYRDSINLALGDDSILFWPILRGMELGIEWYNAERIGDVKSPIIREKFMQTEFERIYRTNDSTEKYFGQFGRCHTHGENNNGRCYEFYVNSVANRIGEIDSTFQDRVMVFPIFYTSQKEYDSPVIRSLNLNDSLLEDGTAFILDLSYLPPQHVIRGYDTSLAYAIICNYGKDRQEQYNFKWDIPKTHTHLGFDYGHLYIRNMGGLNYELNAAGHGTIPDDLISYTYSLDFMRIREGSVRLAYTWFLPVKNGGQFKMGGSYFAVGGAFPFGKTWFNTAPGINAGFGRIWLSETTNGAMPNLFQSGSENTVVYRNDLFLIDPNVQIRIMPRVISLNAQSGYLLDLSGKYWNLDSKLTGYRKSSFSGFYFRVGLSFHLGISD